MYENAIREIARLKHPQVLVPLATRSAVNFLLRYFVPPNLVCMNTNRQELLSLVNGCYKMPADFLREGGRVSLLSRFDMAYLDSLEPEYWYIAYDYVIKGGYLIGRVKSPDERFERWAKAVNYHDGVCLL